MARLFISHSSANNAAAIALCDWLAEQGYEDVFLDIDPGRGLAAGQRWQEALRAAADRCEAVLLLVSPAWLQSKWCQAEFLLAKALHKRIFGVIIESVPIEGLPTEMTAEWQLCELVGEDRLRTFQIGLRNGSAQVSFREDGLERLRRGLERAGLDAKSFPWPPPDEPARAPYRGLKALEEKDAAIFFGRDAWIVRGLDRIRGLAEQRIEKFLVVLGASGSGKSSLLRAGLWPRLLRDDLRFLPLPVVRPQTAVINGNAGLVASLAGAFARLGVARSPARIREALLEGCPGFLRLIEDLRTLAKRRHVALLDPPPDQVVVLPLDQAEELFNSEGGSETATLFDLLRGALAPPEGTPDSHLLVISTMRSDRLELLQGEPRLTGVKRDLFDLPPIPAAEFKSVIEGPAHRATEGGGRLVIDPSLTERLIADSEGADALPLLGFTLERLYADYAPEGKLTLAEYERLGGVQGSIEMAVAGALAEPGRTPAIPADKAAQFAALRAAFIPWLARIDPETRAPGRRVARFSEIPPGSRAIVDRLVEARLLVSDRRDSVDVIEVAHESLLRRWPALTAWLDADAAYLTLIEGVERATTEWVRNGRLETWLDHRGERLIAAESLVVRADFRRRLGESGAAYLAAARRREDAEREERETALAREAARLAEVAAVQARTERLQRRGRWALAALAAVVAFGLAAVLWQQVRLGEREQALMAARTELLAARSGLLARRAAEAFAASPARSYLIAAQGVPWPNDPAASGLPEVADTRYALDRAGSVLADRRLKLPFRLLILGIDSAGRVIGLKLQGADTVSSGRVAFSGGKRDVVRLELAANPDAAPVATLLGNLEVTPNSNPQAAVSSNGDQLLIWPQGRRTSDSRGLESIEDPVAVPSISDERFTDHGNARVSATLEVSSSIIDGKLMACRRADASCVELGRPRSEDVSYVDDNWVVTGDGSMWSVKAPGARSRQLAVALPAGILDMRITRDGAMGLVVRNDQSVVAWRGIDHPVVTEIQSFQQPAAAVALSDINEQIATSFYGGGVRIASLTGGSRADGPVLETAGETISSLTFSRSGEYLLGSAEEGDVFLWQVSGSGMHSTLIRLDVDAVAYAGFASDDAGIVVATRNHVGYWKVAEALDTEERTFGFEKSLYEQMPAVTPNCLSSTELAELGIETEQFGASGAAHFAPSAPARGRHICRLAGGIGAASSKR